MNQYKKLAGNSIIFAIGNLGSSLITFLMLPLYTYKLSTSEYGTVDLIITTAALFLPIVSLSIFDAVLRFAMEKEVDLKKLFSNSLRVTNFGTSFLVVLSLILIVRRETLAFLPVLLILQSYQSLFSQYAKGTGRMKLFASNGILLSLLTATLNIIFLIPLNLGLNGYLWSTCLAYFLSDVFLAIALKLVNEYNKSLIEKKYISNLLKFSLPLIPNSVAWWLTTAVGRYFILFFVGTAGNGLFAVANKIPTILTVFTSIFSQSWQISAIEEFGSKDGKDFFSNVYNAYSQLLLIGCSGIILFLHLIFKILVGGKFYSAWMFVPLLLLSVIFSCLSAFLGSQYIAAKDTMAVLKTTILGALCNVIFNLIFVPFLGINGVGLGSLLSFLIVWQVRERDLQRYFPFCLNKVSFALSGVLLVIQIALLYFLSGVVLYLLSGLLFIGVVFLNRSIIKKVLGSVR